MVNIALVISEFNSEITKEMQKIAEEKAKSSGAKIVATYSVYGAFDIPLALKTALKRKDVDAACVLGAIIKGETDHDKLIASVAADKIASLSLEFEKPVGLGLIGPGVTWVKAKERAEEYANRAVEAALKLHKI